MAELPEDWLDKIKRGGKEREAAFALVYSELCDELGQGEHGFDLFKKMVGLLRQYTNEEAVKAFQNRFIPCVDQEMFKAKAIAAFADSVKDGLPDKSDGFTAKLARAKASADPNKPSSTPFDHYETEMRHRRLRTLILVGLLVLVGAAIYWLRPF